MAETINPVTLFLLSIAGIFLIGALGEVTFQRTSIPDVIWLIAAGIMLGPTLGLLTPELLRSIAPYFAALTLVVVLFEGGAALKLQELSQAAPRSSLLALSSFVTSVIALAAFSMVAAAIGWLPDTWTLTHGLLLGTILGGSSSIIIMPAMAQARLDPKLSNLVSLESALTDAFCVVGTSALIDVMVGGQGTSPALALTKSFGIALAIGLVVGLIWILFLEFLHSNEHAYPLTLSALLVLYVAIDSAGGSAALGILTVAIMLGNAPSLAKFIGLRFTGGLATEVRGFHRQMAFIIKSFFFVFIGAMLGPPWSLLALGALLGAVLFVSRVPAVRLATLGSDFDRRQRQMISVSMPRGMAAGVLATLPGARGVPGTDQLPVLVFACVSTSILIFVAGFPLLKRHLPANTSAPRFTLPAGAARPAPDRDGRPIPVDPAIHGGTARPHRPAVGGDDPTLIMSPGDAALSLSKAPEPTPPLTAQSSSQSDPDQGGS